MRSVSTRRRVKSREVTDEFGNLRHYILTTHRNQDIEVQVNPEAFAPIEITKQPRRLTEEQTKCLVAILQHATKLLNASLSQV
jgi:hypothetical protein